ncbi:hypothetical protein MMC28_009605 [Mycoblastus sanguinarius]|nr:hypothetical protein [Mycoblastus sanguinarius]
MSNTDLDIRQAPQLPNELVLEILEYLPDFSTLFEITKALPQDKILLDTPAWRLLREFVVPLQRQVQRLIRLMMCIRYGNVPDAKELPKVFGTDLESSGSTLPSNLSKWEESYPKSYPWYPKKQPDSLLKFWQLGPERKFSIDYSFHDPVAILQDMGTLSSDMEQLVHSFIETRLVRTHAKMRNAMLQDYLERLNQCNSEGHSKYMHEKHWGPGYCLQNVSDRGGATKQLGGQQVYPSDTPPEPPSPTELHRIRRAFWNLLVYSELFHEPNPKYPLGRKPDGRQDDSGPCAFLNTMTGWELEEIDCIYYHLREQYGLWVDPKSLSYSPQLASRLLMTFGPFRNAWDYDETRRGGEDTRHISYQCGFNREWSCCFAQQGQFRTNWPGANEANNPNAGWKFLDQNQEALHVFQGNFRMSPVSCFHDWGYCIWDRSRLEAWRLVDREPAKFLADKAKTEWWAYGQSKRKVCEHCAYR